MTFTATENRRTRPWAPMPRCRFLVAGGLILLLMGRSELPAWSHCAHADEDVPIDFSNVRDDTPVGYDDEKAYYALLDRVAHQNPQQLRQRALEFVAGQYRRSEHRERPFEQYPLFHEMLTHPEAFRGQPVLLKGHIIRTDSYEAGENPYGIKTLYECWLVTDDSQSHPATVVFIEKPERLPLGEVLVDGVETAGYFLKVYTYPSRDNFIRKAPLILARTVTVRGVSGPADFLRTPLAVAMVVGGVLLLALIVAVVQWRDRRRLRERRARELSERLPDIDCWDR